MMRALLTDGISAPQGRDPGPEPRLEWLPIDALVVDPAYQREVRAEGRRAIEKIAASFEWSKFSAVVVSPVSNARFAIIDGQHRTIAAKLLGLPSVPCIVQHLDRAGQAASFAAINGSVTKITSWNVFKAALAAGEGWAVRADRVAKAAGCRVMQHNKSAKDKQPGEIFGVNTFRDLIERHGEDAVVLALKSYRQSVYGDLLIAWNTTILLAWITAVATTDGAAGRSVRQLAGFHEIFDVLEADDKVQSEAQLARREGRATLPRWLALSNEISDALAAHDWRRAA